MALSEKIQSVDLYDKKKPILTYYFIIIGLSSTLILIDKYLITFCLSYFELTHSVYHVIHKLYKKHYVQC